MLNKSTEASSSRFQSLKVKQKSTLIVEIDEKKPYGLKHVPSHLDNTLSTSFGNPNEISNPTVLADLISRLD